MSRKADIATIRHHHEDQEYGYLIAFEPVLTPDDMERVEELARSAAGYVPCVLRVNGVPKRIYYASPGTDDIVEEEFQS